MMEFYCFGHEDDNFYIITAEDESAARSAVCSSGGYEPEKIKFIRQLRYPAEDYVYINRTWLECSNDGGYKEIRKIPKVSYNDIEAGHDPVLVKNKRPRIKKPVSNDE